MIDTFKKHSLALLVVVAAFGGSAARSCCSSDDARPLSFGSFGNNASQGAAPSTSFSGVVDPTNAAFGPGGMVACSSGCSAPLAEQNRKALKATIDYASAQGRTVYIPPGQYPIARASGQVYGVDVASDPNVSIEGWNAILRFTGDQTSTAGAMLRVRSSHFKIAGVTFSMRDVTNAVADTVAVMVGDSGTTTVDDIHFSDVAFVEGVGGDFLRLDGGTAATKVTNVVVTQGCRFEGSARAGVDVRPGTSKITIAYNFFRANANRDVWFESAGSGVIGQSIVSGNFMERDGTGNAVSVTLSGGSTDAQDQSIFEHNHVKTIPGSATGGGVVEANATTNLQIKNNPIIVNFATATPALNVTGKAVNVQVVGNFVERGTSASNGAVIKVASDGSSAPDMALVKRNRVIQRAGIAPGIDVTGCKRCRVDRNSISYFNATADSGATGFVGVYCTGTTNACSGQWTQNWTQKESGAGRALAGLEWLKGTVGTVGALTIRDNWTDGARAQIYSDADTGSDYPEGYPVVSGNQYANVTNEFEGGIASWRTETTGDAETIATGAASISKHTTFVTTSGTKAYSVADGIVDGAVHCFKITSAISTPIGTMTPAHMADGTTHTLTWTTITAGQGAFCLAWDKTATTYRLQSKTADITLN